MPTSTVVQALIDIRVFKAMPGNSIVLLPDAPVFTIIAATDSYYKTSGRTEEELIGKGMSEAFPSPPDDPEHKGVKQLHTSLETVIQQKRPDQMRLVRYDIENADGTFDKRYWSAINKPVLGEEGEVLYIIHTAVEMTLQVKADQSANRMRSLEKSYDLFMQAPVAIGIAKGSDYVIELANDSLLEVWDRSSADVLGKPLFEGVPDLNGQGYRKLLDQVRESGEPFYGYEHPVRLNRNGKEELLYFDFVYKPYYEDGGTKPAGVFTIGHNVTKQVESRQKFKSVIEEAKDPILILMGEQMVLDTANQALFDLWQVGPEAIGKAFLKILPEMEDQGIVDILKNVLHTGKPFYGKEVPTVFKRKSGIDEAVYFDFSYQPYHSAEGSIAGVLVMARDVSSQVQARKRLEESEERLSNIVNQVNAGIAQTTTSGVFTDANQRFCLLTGYTKEELRERTIKSITHPDDWPRNEELVVEALTESKNFFIEKRYIRKDGSIVWVNNSVSVVTGNKGEKFITAVSVDITEQITNRQKLEESEERFRSMADASPVMIWTLDEAGNSTYYNSRAAAFTGHNEEELREGKSWQVAIHPDDIEAAGGVVRNAVFNRIPYEMECRMQRADGEWRWLLNHGTPRFGRAGEYFGFVGSSIDITEHKKSEQELQTALEQVQLSKVAAELGTFDMDLEKGTMHWDDRCRTLFGISHHNIVTYEQDFVRGLHPDDRERILKVIDRLFIKSVSDGDYDVEYRTVGAEDGVVRWVRAKGKVYFNEQENPVRFIGSVLDITEKVTAIQRIEALVEERTKELAEANGTLQKINKELQRSNQNLEEFAHAASHDLKEPVRKIHFFTSQLKDQLSTHLKDAHIRSFNRIESATQRMGSLIDDLLLYSHVSQRPHETGSVDLNEKVQRVLEDLELDITEKNAVINIEKLPVVKGYRRQLQQLFQNLISNALKYSKEDVCPRIDITARSITENGKLYHLIEVKDNGIGFQKEYADKIFQMFTRLHGKTEYSGTGVGLSIVKKVVENHNGVIKADSTPGEGSTFSVLLPIE